ncbi:MAG: hypothetical protein QF714_03595 [Dehalococcoidia bacterium]|jgi:hypothetical protein|nr:hypothetical protein [Dehalococcoidia bacterium]MDP6226775.1 hypothetical protein [Dehalococcoidia bacterium]MDP7085052.1 hypothetical protein [Dehalococcoidia bacterium]MDP7201996.1 hypothetical protein [Dehalococcoidia bacterium]HJN85574.1 hypothetical protein [Dehalococcoidia bacterium]
MGKRRFKLGTAISLGGLVAAAPLIAACASGPTYDDWAATDGAAGLINLDDVQAAFKSSKSATDFERKVNEIYEGDGLVIIRAKQDGSALTLEGWEDLNGDNDINEAQDDQLFSIVKGTNNEYDMRGHGGNGYYGSHFGAGNFLFTYMLISAISPRGYYYSTPVSRGAGMRSQRTSYRQSSSYSRQVARNTNYSSKQSSFRGSSYQTAKGNLSSNRNTYRSTQKTSGSFKSSGAIARSSSGKASSIGRSSGGGRSGGRGGAGSMKVRGHGRF